MLIDTEGLDPTETLEAHSFPTAQVSSTTLSEKRKGLCIHSKICSNQQSQANRTPGATRSLAAGWPTHTPTSAV